MGIKCLAIFIFCVLLQSSLVMQNKSSQQTAKHDPAPYDKAGPYSVGNELSPPARSRVVGEIRGFLWEHWKQRRVGRVTATFYTIEGDPTSSTFFIEPDTKGCWSIRVESVSTISALLPKGRRPRYETTKDSYDAVERIEAIGGSPATSTPIPEQDARQPQTYKLRLKNTRTNSVQIL